MMKKRIYAYVCLALLVFSLLSCSRPLSWNVETSADGPFSYGPPTNVNFQLSSYSPGDDAKLTLTFDIKEGDLETHKAVITYPGQFTFNGFLALGPAGTQIGSYDVDFDFDGTSDFTIPIFSVDNNTAYADRNTFDGPFDGSVDSTMVYTNPGGNHVFTTSLPFGGDGRQDTITGPFTERLTAVMNSGVITNPATPGTYTLNATFTSVDPDTDAADDAAGDPPLTLNPSQDIVIVSAGGDPVPDIKANVSDGPITVGIGETLLVSISLTADAMLSNADWWVVLYTPFAPPDDWFHLDLNSGWTPGLSFTYQGQLFDLGTSPIFDMDILPAGKYTFYFAVDTNMNGVLDLDIGTLFFDSVTVTVE